MATNPSDRRAIERPSKVSLMSKCARNDFNISVKGCFKCLLPNDIIKFEKGLLATTAPDDRHIVRKVNKRNGNGHATSARRTDEEKKCA